MEIIWTEEAKDDLHGIFNYYDVEASREVAEKIIAGIIESTNQLISQPNSGQKEPLLHKRKLVYRYLVKGNYKIIYWIEPSQVYIASVFDCRQNPTKMKVV